MKSKKFFKITGILLALLSTLTLFFPMYSTYVTDGEAATIVVRGYNLVEFSPWGGIVVLTPLALIGWMLSRLRPEAKTAGMLGLFLLDGVAFCGASAAAYAWISDIATGLVEPYMAHPIYALLLFLSMVCFWVSNTVSFDKFWKSETVSVEPIDHRKETFYWYHKPCNLVKYKENGSVTNDEAVLCFATSEGYFATLGDGDPAGYCGVEVMENEEAVGFVMGTMPTGLYGTFYERRESLTDPDMTVEIRAFADIDRGEAELRISDKTGWFSSDEVTVTPYAPDDIRVSSIEGLEEPPAIGAAVMQGEELIAFVTAYDAENHEYHCVSAERVAQDLCRKIYEQRVVQAKREFYNNNDERRGGVCCQ